MTPMQHAVTSEPPSSEPPRTETPSTEKAYGDRYFKTMILPGFGIAPILPVWLTERVSRLFKRVTSSH
jgi:hypothetical protein